MARHFRARKFRQSGQHRRQDVMQILGAGSPADPVQSVSAPASSSNTLTGASDQLTKESTFLNLLVAQIKNQNPLNPTDSMQFVGQLVQFSQLEQLLGINQGVQTLLSKSSSTPQPPMAPSVGDNSTSSITEQ